MKFLNLGERAAAAHRQNMIRTFLRFGKYDFSDRSEHRNVGNAPKIFIPRYIVRARKVENTGLR